ncbi:hypothetical protein BE61_20280 [Bradyrhizobium elkanii USDA 61]|nr:hypothetical protein BE61_20280 [Bradyrhizobium elkanii USDA 61]
MILSPLVLMAGKISVRAKREITSALAERYRSSGRIEKGRSLDELCAVTGWHPKHTVRALRPRETVGPGKVETPQERKRRYGANGQGHDDGAVGGVGTGVRQGTRR